MGFLRRLERYLTKPEYLYRPGQVLRRLACLAQPGVIEAQVQLPWGLTIQVCPTEVIGRAIWHHGVYDLAVTEALWRLIDPGEVVVDAGANIGYMTSLMAKRVGRTGSVWSFEPHPALFAALAANVERWSASAELGRVHLRPLALSDVSGRMTLVEGPGFASNLGTARVIAEAIPPDEGAGAGPGGYYSVDAVTLDEALGEAQRIGVLKLDVEGHELPVLKGARRLLEDGRIRDVVFEEHLGFPSPVSTFLAERNYQVLRLEERLTGPKVEPARPGQPLPVWAPPSYLGTHDPARALARLGTRGWAGLRGR